MGRPLDTSLISEDQYELQNLMKFTLKEYEKEEMRTVTVSIYITILHWACLI